LLLGQCGFRAIAVHGHWGYWLLRGPMPGRHHSLISS
jgi:hypothetical protein